MEASDLSPAVLQLVEELRTPTESIWMCSESENEQTVFLIEDDDISTAKAMREIGLSGGGGRVLHFANQDGGWRFSHESRYIC